MKSSIIVSGKHFSGYDFYSIGQSLIGMIRETKKELIIVSYSFSYQDTRIMKLLKKKRREGKEILIILGKISNYLKNQKDSYQNEICSEMLFYEDKDDGVLHAKTIISDRRKAIIGSSNLTIGGTLYNHEVGVLIEGKEVWDLANLLYSFAAKLRSKKHE